MLLNNASLSQTVKSHLEQFFAMHESSVPATGLHSYIIDEIEKILIIETLHHVDNVQSKAAKILGINRNTLRKKIHQHNLLSYIDNN